MYVASGYGGYAAVPTAPKAKRHKASTPAAAHDPTPTDFLTSANVDYNSGQYRQAEETARVVVEKTAHSRRLPDREVNTKARMVVAYSQARQKDLKSARQTFAVAAVTAAALPDHGEPPAPIGQQPTGLDEDALYQHAVCTAALGDKAGAEKEYRQFMRDHPDSPLLQAAIKRIAWMHDGNIPVEATSVWKQAMATALKHQQTKQREASLCGPQCLSELLRRRGETVDVHQLADEMKTGPDGTTLEALAEVAKQHGFEPRGVALTAKGLSEQKLPVIALLRSQHYVIVERVTPENVTIWDPAAGQRQEPLKQWQRQWLGVALAMWR